MFLHCAFTQQEEFEKMRKINEKRRSKNTRLEVFQGKFSKTMPHCPENIFKDLEKSKVGKNRVNAHCRYTQLFPFLNEPNILFFNINVDKFIARI